MDKVVLPRVDQLIGPVLRAVADLGGSGSVGEILDMVVKREGFTEEQQAVMHREGPETELSYRLGWARTALKREGLLANSTRGVWSLTESGVLAATASGQGDSVAGGSVTDHGDVTAPSFSVEPDDVTWKEQLLVHLMSMQPDAFERLSSRLLREAGVDNVTVTGKSGDGGIDGRGVLRVGLVSFPVFFQSRRYQGSVGSGVVRDFRGAMAGRGDKGFLITTGTFTPEAKKEANRDGVPPVDLIDGDRLCDLLKDYELGVRTVKVVTVDAAFFADM
jgi:restriction system protein